MTGRRGNRESWTAEEANARGYYEAFVWMGTRGNGRPDRRHLQRRSLPELKKAVRKLERERDAGKAPAPGRRTVEQMLTRHLEVVLPQRGRAPRTISDYRSKCRNDIFPRWGAQRIERLRPDHIEDGYAEMLAAGHKPSHVRKVHAILSSAYEIEVKRGNVARNPCALVEQPALGPGGKSALTLAQARRVLEVATGRRNGARWAVGLACGLRQGEVLGLRWDYADLDAAELRVWWQLQRLTWEHGCTDPAACAAGRCRTAPCPPRCKRHTRECPAPCRPGCTGHARHCPARKLPAGCVSVAGGLVLREVKERRRKSAPLAPELVPPLKTHRARQAQERLAAGGGWEDHGLIFCSAAGRPVDPRADWQEWKAILAEAGVPHVGVHGGRHSTATFGLDQGVALSVVKELLGHSDIRITEGYTHVSSPLAHDGAARIGRALFGPAATTTATTGEAT